MEGFVSILHIIVALTLIALVLLQDNKSGSIGGAFGGGGSSSVFGATGAATLAQKLTRYAAVIFAVTSILLSIFSGRLNKSVMDGAAPAAQSVPAPTVPGTAPAVPADANAAATAPTTTPAQQPAAQAPAAATPAPAADAAKK
jgi:preprotein translocase subunit SecG